jgi:hypothetical protein
MDACHKVARSTPREIISDLENNPCESTCVSFVGNYNLQVLEENLREKFENIV